MKVSCLSKSDQVADRNKLLTNGSSAFAASAAVLISVMPLLCSTVAATTIKLHLANSENSIPKLLSIRIFLEFAKVTENLVFNIRAVSCCSSIVYKYDEYIPITQVRTVFACCSTFLTL